MKAYFLTSAQEEPERYDKNTDSKQSWKFLLYKKGEQYVLAVGFFMLSSHSIVHSFAKRHKIFSGELIGAGDMDGGKIVSWSSSHFSIETPENLRPMIEQAIE